jgi:hypothetical protein
MGARKVPVHPDDVMSRAEMAGWANGLRASGWTWQQIQAECQISQSYLGSLLRDPDGAKDRRRKKCYGGVCIDCGGRTSYDTGGPAKRCAPCRITWEQSEENRAARTIWTKQAIVAEIQRVGILLGRRPKCVELQPPLSALWYPMVYRSFPSFNEALKAAGYEPRQRRPGQGRGGWEQDEAA